MTNKLDLNRLHTCDWIKRKILKILTFKVYIVMPDARTSHRQFDKFWCIGSFLWLIYFIGGIILVSSLSPYSSLSIEVIPYIQSVRFVEIYAIGLVAIVVSAWFVSSVYIYLKYSLVLCVYRRIVYLYSRIFIFRSLYGVLCIIWRVCWVGGVMAWYSGHHNTRSVPWKSPCRRCRRICIM